jgi:hypothetical protein
MCRLEVLPIRIQNMCIVLSVVNINLLDLMHFFFHDRGKRSKKERSRKRVEQLVLRHDAEKAMAATVERAKAAAEMQKLKEEADSLDGEADRLADLLNQHVADKKKRDYHIRLLQDEVKRRKTNPLGLPMGPSAQDLQEDREKQAEKKEQQEEYRRKAQLERDLLRKLAEHIEREKENDRRVKAARAAKAHAERSQPPAEIWPAARAIAVSRGRELPNFADFCEAYRSRPVTKPMT